MEDAKTMSNPDSVGSLSEKLLKIYTGSNLNNITSTIIHHYKLKEFDVLKHIANALSEHVSFGTDQENFKTNKYFAKLVFLYHPDKITSYHRVINNAVKQNSLEDLEKLSHIFITTSILNEYKSVFYSKDKDDTPRYDPDITPDMNDYIFDLKYDTSDIKEYHYDLDSLMEDFYNMDDYSFGTIYHDLDINDECKVVLTSVGMKNLNEIEFFKDMIYLDLSRNKLNDISNLWYLEKLEELYLADNKIFGVFALSNLKKLRILDLSNNNIDDISGLEYLGNLEFVNLINNPLHEDQIDKLRLRVKTVLF